MISSHVCQAFKNGLRRHAVCSGTPSRVFISSRRSLASLSTAGQMPAIVHPSPEELAGLALNARNLEKAVRHVHRDGLVVIQDVVPHDMIDKLNTQMVHDAKFLQAKGDKGPFNYNQGNLQQDPPPVAEHFHPGIFTNPFATQVTSAVLGSPPLWTFCSANAAMPPLPGQSAQRQPVHSDADFSHPDHPFALVINVPLVDMTPENGSTELWLGTHTADVSAQEDTHGERASGRIKEHLLEGRRQQGHPPVQPPVRRGSLVVRDLRLWHAGMPNHTSEVRIMLAMIYFAPWYRNSMRLELASDVEPILDGLRAEGKLGLQVPVDWTTREQALNSYLNRGFGNSYVFDQEA